MFHKLKNSLAALFVAGIGLLVLGGMGQPEIDPPARPKADRQQQLMVEVAAWTRKLPIDNEGERALVTLALQAGVLALNAKFGAQPGTVPAPTDVARIAPVRRHASMPYYSFASALPRS